MYATEEGIDAYMSPDKIKHGEKVPLIRGRIPKFLGITERMKRKELIDMARVRTLSHAIFQDSLIYF